MARAKAQKHRIVPTADEIADQHRPVHIETPADTERATAIRNYRPADGRSLPPHVQDRVITLVLNTPYKSQARDLDLTATLTQNALYHLNVHGDYDVTRALSEEGISRWTSDDLKRRGMHNDSRGDYASRLRAVARDNGLAPHLKDRTKHTRTPAKPPADPKEWRRTLERADRLREPIRTDFRILADLTFGAGLRPSECARARRDDMARLSNGTAVIRIANNSGVLRTIPIGPLMESRIYQAPRDATDWLIRPTRSRKNVINELMSDAEALVTDIRFDVYAARHRYIVDLLASPIPFRVVAELADLGRGHLLADLAPYVPMPTEQKIAEIVRGCW